jgi:glucose/arabinose dehydrogenase
VRRAHRRPEKLLPASRWQNPPARCRRHSGGPGAARGLACFDLIRSVAGFARVALTGLCLAARAATPEPFELKDGDRVLFIGDTFFEREVDYGHIETRLTAAFPDRTVTFRNLGWAADTPMGRSRASFDWNKPETEWLKRVKEQVALVRPTVAFLSYGMTAALDLSGTGASAAERNAAIEKFKTDLGKLMDAIEEVSGQKVRFVLLGPLQRDAGTDTEKEIAQFNNGSLREIDDATRQLAQSRQARFVSLSGLRYWAKDGIHSDQSGYEDIADELLRELGQKVASRAGSEFVTEKGRKPGGAYPDLVQYETLRSAIRKKNELFFHRWRPANWTYLLGFRKGEQGQNAVELPRFEPLIEEWERRIAKLRDLKHQDAATVKEVRSLLDVRSSMFDVSGSGTNIEHSTSNAGHRIASLPLPTFDVADGFEVNLWAEDPQLHKPIEINWDAQGRLWVASSEVYPQIKPGQPATDSVVVLEDKNGDGRADKSSVFAEGLLIPTGVLPDSDGGCYVAASHQLFYFKDTNGDGKADEKRIVLSSFGTEDTHHNLHTLRWGYDGHIYMNQSIYTHTHVETPHGVVHLNSGGIWRFDPDTYRLEVFTRGGCNPWGHAWDEYGNSFFTDGAGFQGVSYCVPGAMYFTYAGARRELQSISPGSYPKFASLEIVRSPQFPDDWQGDFITCDFRAHRVVHFKYSEAGAGFQTREMPDLLRSTNVTFRPIDVKFGPDGALYIADWSNPIIQHGEVDFRDSRRDKEHGRIWRVTAKGRPLATRHDLAKSSISELLDRTLSRNRWEQEQARRVLRLRESKTVFSALDPWLQKQADPRARLEAMWLHEAFDKPDTRLALDLAASKDENLRAAATRQLSR